MKINMKEKKYVPLTDKIIITYIIKNVSSLMQNFIPCVNSDIVILFAF